MKSGVGEMIPFPSIWGHWAGGPPGNFEDVKWLDEKLASLFSATKGESAAKDVDALKLT